MKAATIIVVLILINVIENARGICISEYGTQPCKYTPAPPGRTPSCARPGNTYCEHPNDYPGQLILHLVKKWKYDHSTLLSNESPEDFDAYYPKKPIYGPPKPVYGPPKPVYGPPNPTYGPPNTIQDLYPPDPEISLKPPVDFHGNAYIPPTNLHNYTDGFSGYPDRKPYDLIDYHNQNRLNYYESIGQPQITHYNPNDWWKRTGLSRRKKRSLHQFNLMQQIRNSTNSIRSKRQNPITGQTLCQTRSEYIMPRAALNNKGNWMYVVNMPELDSRLTQLVKSETCLSQQCSGLCSLPNGYTSRCEQKFVQKRLVALEGTGDKLYTDVFWFPSCCICTLSN